MASLDTREERHIQIRCSDDEKVIRISEQALRRSKLFKFILENDKSDDQVELTHISYETMRDIQTYLEYYRDRSPTHIPSPLPQDAFWTEIVSHWDVKFLQAKDPKHDQSKLFRLIEAANYLQIDSLLDLTCARLAVELRGSPSQLTETFGLNRSHFNDKDIDRARQCVVEDMTCVDITSNDVLNDHGK
jgi:S-phase kinase-associated protein 1